MPLCARCGVLHTYPRVCPCCLCRGRRECECDCTLLYSHLHYLLGTGVLPVCSACAAGTRCPPCCQAGEPSLPVLCGVGLCPPRVLLPCLVYVDGEARGPGCVHGGGRGSTCCSVCCDGAHGSQLMAPE